mmetsp:Transcript_17158/g.41314  ORF Transcript_17158/g.41314 Transcript_17158/m.41314 type:complete len:764 (-) Transcript_17158:523-2814(-)
MMPSAGQDIVQEWDTLEDGYFSPVDVRVLCKEVLEERESMRRTLAEKHERVGLLRFSRPQSTGSTGPSQTTHAYEAIGGLGQLIYVRETTLDGPEMCQQQWERVQNLMVDMETLRSLEHPNVVSYLGVTLTDSRVCIVTELCSGGSLTAVLQRFGALEQNLVRKFTCQILEGLLYLHKHGITHRDLNLSNCLLDTDGNVKLSNVGESRFLGTFSGPSFSTTLYCPPEVFHGLPCGRHSDIWSLGVCVVEMYLPSGPNTPVSHLYFERLATMQEAPPAPDTCCQVSKSFINSCRTIDPRERPNALALREHPFVAGWFTNSTGRSGSDGLRQRSSSNVENSGPTTLNPMTTRGSDCSADDTHDAPGSKMHWQVEDSTEDAHQGAKGASRPGISRPQSSFSPKNDRGAPDWHKQLSQTLSSLSSSSEKSWATEILSESSIFGVSKKGRKKVAVNYRQLNKVQGSFCNPVLEAMYVSQYHQYQFKPALYMFPFMHTAGAILCIHELSEYLWETDADDYQLAANRTSVFLAIFVVAFPLYVFRISKKKEDPEWVMNAMMRFQDLVTYPYITFVVLREKPLFSIARITFICSGYALIATNTSRIYVVCSYYFLLVLVYNMWNAYVYLSVSPENVTPLLSLVLPDFLVSYLPHSSLCLISKSFYSFTDFSGVSHILSQLLSDPDPPASLSLQDLQSLLSQRCQAVLIILMWLSAGAFISNRTHAYNRLVWLMERMDEVKEAEKAVCNLRLEGTSSTDGQEGLPPLQAVEL